MSMGTCVHFSRSLPSNSWWQTMAGWKALSRPPAAEGGGRRPAFTGLATQPYSATEVDGWQHKAQPGVSKPGRSTLERLEPAPSHLVEVPPQARAVSGNRIVVQVPFEHLIQPCPGLGNRVVHSSAQLHLDRLQLSQHPLLDRLAPDDERAPFA